MSVWVAILLGIIQGIFMFFPVSSTSHLALMQHFLISRGIELPDPDSAEMILFDLIVHVGTLISIAYVFRRSLKIYLSNTISGFLELLSKEHTARGALYRKLTFLGLFSVFITGVFGFPMKSVFESVFAQPLFMSGTLIITGVILWWTDYLTPRKFGLKEIGIWIAFVIGAAQALALLPGLSRSGMTIAFALFAGLNRRWAAEYSFFIAFPTILGATLLQAVEVFGYGGTISIGLPAMATGFMVSAIIGILALKLVIHLLYRAQFRVFSYYVWVLAIVVAVSSFTGIL